MLALKPFLETIKTYCAKLTKEELVDLLCQSVLDVPAEERVAFLEKLSIASVPSNVQQPEAAQDEDANILDKAEKLIDDIADWQQSVEDGSYYETHWEDGDYNDEEFPSISKEQQEILEKLFTEADGLFLAGKLELAGKAYQRLIDLALHSAGLDYGIDHNDLDVNWRETLARYCRCLYETSSAQERVKRVLAAMEAERKTEAEQPLFGVSYNPAKEIFPSLRDVFDARPGHLADWNDFLKKVQKKLHGLSSNRPVLLYLEASYWLEGIQGLAAEVRERKIPVGYLYWLNQLQESKAWSELAKAAQEALQVMPLDGLRAQAAGQLCLAGEQIGNSDLVMLGKREQLFSQPKDRYLSTLLQEALHQKTAETELHRVLDFFAGQPLEDRSVADKMLELKTFLLLGKLDQIYSKLSTKKAIGWSGEEQPSGAVYAALLLVLSKGNPSAATIHALFGRYTCGKQGSDAFLCEEMKKSLLKISFTAFQQSEWFSFIERITAGRIEHIVSNKYRKGYARAAEALGGYLECLTLHGQPDKAAAFLHSQRDEKYKRYPAFRQEVDTILKNSPLVSMLRTQGR